MRPNRALTLLKILIAASLLATAAHIALKYASIVGYNEQHGFLFELSNRFDLNDENSVPQWLSQTLFLSIALVGLIARFLAERKDERRFWTVVTVLGTVLSLDDASTLHEFVLQTIHNTFYVDTAPTFFRNAWLLILPFVLVGFIWLCVKMVKLLPRRTTVLLTLSGTIFIIGAVIVDSFANNVAERSFAGQGLMGALEGGLQLVALSIFIYALVDYVERTHGKKIAVALNGLKRRA